MTALSVLDLMMVGEDKTFTDTLNDAVALARHVETHGYKRYWVAEHHDLPGIASSATTLLVQHLAAATRTLRVGSGGIMLPNHSPLMVAEQFGTLATLFPGRIDLGIGRAPGSAGAAIRALRGDASERDFTQDIRHVQDYLADNGHQPVRAIPGPHDVPLWLLGSSMNSADLAAKLGLPYAFASHFAPRFFDGCDYALPYVVSPLGGAQTALCDRGRQCLCCPVTGRSRLHRQFSPAVGLQSVRRQSRPATASLGGFYGYTYKH